MNKIPIGIKSCEKNIERRLSIIDTWLNLLDANIFFPIFLIGHQSEYKLDSNILYLNCNDSYSLLYTKTIAYFDWCLKETSASHFWIVDDDSYINTKIFNNYKEYLDYDYSGNFIYGINKHNDTSGYTSGCGYCLSRKAVTYLLDHVSKLIKHIQESKKTFYEDILVGDTLNAHMPDVKKLHIPKICPWSYCQNIPNLMIGHYVHKGDNAATTFYESMKKMHSFYI